MLTANEIRESFKAFFASKGHTIVPSAPMVVKGDPTLMFTNAGMNQWKDIILGIREPEPRRRADSQKCLRVSGKHNDLEEVGHDTYHHTMFEMLGNWSFGDYFKEGAIDMAWEYLVDVLHLDPADLYVTVFEGSPEEHLERDDEAASYWAKHVPADHIINGNKHDNFWEMGDTGPCGPCSEIHLDSRTPEEKAQIPGRELVNKDNPQVIEIWNLVFMQFNRKADGSLEKLGMNVIDTGMGFERLVRALQGKHSNYDTDIFQPIIQEISRLSGKEYGKEEDIDVAMRVVADHLRAVAFSIADGQLPSNAKAGYVIRRILRRAVRYSYTFLGQKEAFIYKLLPVQTQQMGGAYTELIAQKALIEKVIKEEEDAFLRTLETGIRLLDKKIEDLQATGQKTLSGSDAFTLYDTYGFPLDLTELILREHNMDINIDEFNVEMQKQKERARNAAAVETGDWVTLKEGETEFVGYDLFECDAEILRYRQVKQKNKVLYQLVLDRTPFYAEMGGQVGDTGWLINGDEKVNILDTKRENNLPIHIVEKLPQDVTAEFVAKINVQKRIQCECNHSATHLLHEALREVLGKHVEQKGSFVSPEALRFDFSHFQKVSDEEIRQVEKLVSEKIRANYALEEYRNMPIEQAKEMGAMALFGEKYGDKVRVVKYGNSIELCGGTHIPATGMIGSLRVISESSVAAGVRRIEAVTAEAAENYTFMLQDSLRELRAMFNNVPNLAQTIRKSIEENAELKKEVQEYIKEKVQQIKKDLLANAIERNGVKVIVFKGEAHIEAIKDVAFQVKGEAQETGKVFFVGGIKEGAKCALMVSISDALVKEGLNAGKLVKDAAKLIQGGGGGQPHFATAGGKNSDGLDAAVDAILNAAELK